MANHAEACKSVFREMVLPHFPPARERFDRYFLESYRLIRMLPEIPAPGLRRIHPDARKCGEGGCTVSYFGIELGLTALGLKPVALPAFILANSLKRLLRSPAGESALADAGLEVLYHGAHGIEFYDPAGAAPILSSLLNRPVSPEGAKAAMRELRSLGLPLYPAELLGYPEEADPVERALTLRVGSRGFTGSAGAYHVSHLACRIRSPEALLPTLAPRAAAVASVGEIRESPPGIESFAAVCPVGKYDSFLKRVSVTRGKTPGDWTVVTTPE